jgi:ankyrin repeat protein
MVQELLSQGAHSDLPDETKTTPLHRACKYGHGPVVKELLQTRKVDPNTVNTKGWTPVLYAAAAGSTAVITLLMEHSRDKHLEDHYMQQRVAAATDADAELDVLLLGAKYGHKAVVELALQNGANRLSKDAQCNTGAHLACMGGTEEHMDIMWLLLDKGIKHNRKNKECYTPLLLATHHMDYCR